MVAVTAVVVVLVLVVAGAFDLVSRQQKQQDDAEAKESATNSTFIPKVEMVPASIFNTVGAGSTSQVPTATNGPADTV